MDNTDFLARFPEEAITRTINKKRIDGFLRATRANFEKFSSLKPEAAEFIKKLNNLGFVTFDSQEGIHRETKDPTERYGKNKGMSQSFNDSKVILETYSERAYCDGFIRNDVLNLFKKFLKSESQKVVEHPYNGITIVLTKYFKCEDGNNYQQNGTNIHPDDDDENYGDTVKWEISQLSDESGYCIGFRTYRSFEVDMDYLH